ncbi:hypothetical protein DL95DRAFT_391460 [Leptodontidium sp. 2 PMI_412]|nr:hypothetical protein DL95DRAFT_391460 [Leptodontidium sp. 2 PMI_412]
MNRPGWGFACLTVLTPVEKAGLPHPGHDVKQLLKSLQAEGWFLLISQTNLSNADCCGNPENFRHPRAKATTQPESFSFRLLRVPHVAQYLS